jgi:hypothetical protein
MTMFITDTAPNRTTRPREVCGEVSMGERYRQSARPSERPVDPRVPVGNHRAVASDLCGVRTPPASRRALIALAVGLAVVGGAVWYVQEHDTPPTAIDTEDVDGSERADHTFTIPAGTGDRVDAGERVAILPPQLTVRVGEVLVIVNEDDRGHAIGPFYVGPGQTLRQRFAAPGEFEGECSVHPDGSLRLVVVP